MPHIEVHKKNRDRVRYVDIGDGPAEIGRSSDATVTLHDYAVSRHHCLLECVAGGWVVRDLGSRHGIKVNGDATDEELLTDGDSIRIGPYTLVFRLVAAPSEDEQTQRSESAGDAKVLEERVASLERALADRQAALLTSEKQVEALRSQLSKRDAEAPLPLAPQVDTAEAERLREELEAVRQERNRLADELAQATTRLIEAEENPRTDDTVDTLRAELEQTRGELESVTNERDELQAVARESGAETVRLRGELDGVAIEHEKLERELAAANAKLVDLEKAGPDHDQLEALQEELAGVRSQLESVTGERDAVRADLASTKDSLAQLSDREAALRTEVDEAHRARDVALSQANEASAAEAQLASVRLERDQARERADVLSDDLDRVRGRAQDLERQLAEVSTDRDSLRAELSTLVTESRETLARIADVDANLNEMAGALETSQADCARLIGERDELQRRLDRETAAHAENRARMKDLDNELADLRAAAEQDAPADPKDLERLRSEVSDAGKRIGQLERELAIASQNRDEFKRRLGEIDEERQTALNRVRIAQTKLESVERELTAVSARAREYEQIVAQYVSAGKGSDNVNAQIVEMTEEEIARARAEGATVVELDVTD